MITKQKYKAGTILTMSDNEYLVINAQEDKYLLYGLFAEGLMFNADEYFTKLFFTPKSKK